MGEVRVRDDMTVKNIQPAGTMRVVSVNVGLPRTVTWHGKAVTTGIFKEPVAGRVAVRQLNLDGDRQADLSVHGGLDKALYAYPAEYYRYWRAVFPDRELPWGQFGENLTVEGLLDATVHIGDRFRVGSATLVVTQPRLPCYKLGLRFGRADMVRRFLQSGLTGFYLAVLEEGDVAAGDPISPLARDAHGLAVAEITRLYLDDRADPDVLRRAAEITALPESWRNHFRTRIARAS